MKERLSVMMLAARGSIYKVILLILATGIVQAGLFYWCMAANVAAEDSTLSYHLETGLSESGIILAAGVAFVLLCAVLSLNGCCFGARSVYTFRRLAVSEGEIVVLWAVNNALMFLLFWASQILIMLGLCGMFAYLGPILQAQRGVVDAEIMMGPQTVYVAFYRHKYLHSLMPMAEISRWIRNIVLMGSLGICTATFSNSIRYGKKGISVFVVVVVTIGMFCSGVGALEIDLISGLVALAAGACSMWHALGGVADET